MMLGTLASRFLGLAREILVAAFFGATRQLDAFYVAYTLANLSRQLLAEGALSASFVPVFSRTLESAGKRRALSLARQAMTVLLVAGTLTVVGGILCAPWLARILAPGFSGEGLALAARMTRMVFPFLLFVSLAALAMGVLNSMERFFVSAVAPACSNIAFITVAVLLAERIGVWSLVAAVLLGGLIQWLLQWFWAAHLAMPLIPAKPRRDDPELRRMLALFLPYAAGLSLNQVNPVISRMLASFLEGGTISAMNYADRVLQLPLGLFVVAISQAVLPLLSRLSADEGDAFVDFMRDALRFALFIVVPVMAGMVLVSRELVHLLFFRGAFDLWALERTSGALAMFALGLPGMACTTVLMRALYALGLPRGAMVVTGSGVVVNLTASLTLMQFLGYRGIALGIASGFTASAFCGYLILRHALGRGIPVFESAWNAKILAAAGAMAGSVVLWTGWIPYPEAAGALLRAGWMGVTILVGAACYTLLTLRIGCDEWSWIRGALRRKQKGKDV